MSRVVRMQEVPGHEKYDREQPKAFRRAHKASISHTLGVQAAWTERADKQGWSFGLALPSPSKVRTALVLEARHCQMYAQDWPPYAYQNSTTMELSGIGKDIADGLTATCATRLFSMQLFSICGFWAPTTFLERQLA